MSVQEKASLTSGRDFWTTTEVGRLGVPSVTVTDGPHGVRLQTGASDHLGLGQSEPATCFPTASALAASWDPELVAEVGRAIARECLAFGVGVLLGPGVNLKRSPLCGRNFEYFSEDPLLAGALATAFVEGVQSQGVGASLKHFAGNDQEFRRMTIDSVVDERTLRELELAAFEQVVTHARPWTVMAAYNRLNGVHACENEWLLDTVLRQQWGFDGVVVSDWGAVGDRVDALRAGCDLTMPGSDASSDQRLVDAVTRGELDVTVLDVAATRLTRLALHAQANRGPAADVDHDAHHRLARRAAADAVVLLRNVDAVLPLRATDDVALIGHLAVEPRYQGTGSSRITPTRLDNLLEELAALHGIGRVVHADGYDHPIRPNEPLLERALRTARAADVTIVCVGLPDGYENEGNDRSHLRLPPTHDALVGALAAVSSRVVVVLSNGAPVEMPWVHDVAAVVEGYLGGQAGAGGLADVITGTVDPAGHLAETFPCHLDDVPAQRNFPGGPNTVEHREGLYVGYRYHDTVGGEVLFPFGHGLAYTTFEVGRVGIDHDSVTVADLAGGATVTVEVGVTNTGDLPGRTVLQVYVRDVEAAVYRPDRELRAFAKVALEPGASEVVRMVLPGRAFAYWHPDRRDFVVEPGDFELLVGLSSRDLRGTVTLRVEGAPFDVRDEPAVYRSPPRYLDVDAGSFEALLGGPRPGNPGFGRPFDRNTPIGATAATPLGRILVGLVERRLRAGFGDDPANEALVSSMLEEAPLRTLLMGGVTEDQLDTIVDLLNGDLAGGANRAVAMLRRVLARG